jgi:hypothetical protein
VNIADAPILEDQRRRIAITHQHEVEQETPDTPIAINIGMNGLEAVMRNGCPRLNGAKLQEVWETFLRNNDKR